MICEMKESNADNYTYHYNISLDRGHTYALYHKVPTMCRNTSDGLSERDGDELAAMCGDGRTSVAEVYE